MRAWAGSVVLAAVVIGLAGCGSAHSGTTAAAKTTPPPPEPQPSASAVIDTPSTSPMDDWCTNLSGGYANLSKVNDDLNAIKTDYGNGQFGSVENDGTKLVEDSAAAQEDPPPGTAHQRKVYVKYMKVVSLVGGDMAQGDFNLGVSEVTRAAPYHAVMQHIADQCAVAWGGSPAA